VSKGVVTMNNYFEMQAERDKWKKIADDLASALLLPVGEEWYDSQILEAALAQYTNAIEPNPIQLGVKE
jgi:hypothetical protein